MESWRRNLHSSDGESWREAAVAAAAADTAAANRHGETAIHRGHGERARPPTNTDSTIIPLCRPVAK